MQAYSPPGPKLPMLTCWQSLCLSVLRFSGLDLFLPQHGTFFILLCVVFVLFCFFFGGGRLGILKYCLFLCPAIGHRQLYLPTKANWGQGPSVSYMQMCKFLCNFGNPINTSNKPNSNSVVIEKFESLNTCL
jgi:hypothetical protein